MGAQGHTTIDFGAFPGSPDAVVTVTDGGIQTTSDLEAWVRPVATADHSIAEHYVDPPRVMAGEIIASTSFKIRGFAQPGGVQRCYGLWTVSWVWN